MRLYRGDIVYPVSGGRRMIVREVVGGRVKVQVGNDWTWVWADDLVWDGDCLVKLPYTERGWRRMAGMIKE